MAPDEHFTSSRDQIEAENAFLRLKLELEHHLKEYGNSEVPPEVENIFLRSIYAFEQKRASHSPISANDGRQPFRRYSDLRPDELAVELQRLHEAMRKGKVVLDCICEYEDGVIYKFFAGEIAEKPEDGNTCKEMIIHFIYEESHPDQSAKGVA